MQGPYGMTEDLGIADVLLWGAHNIYIRCPFCDKTHHYEMTVSYPLRDTRTVRYPLVSSLPHEYEIRFPLNGPSEKVAYEIDKAKKRFHIPPSSCRTNTNPVGVTSHTRLYTADLILHRPSNASIKREKTLLLGASHKRFVSIDALYFKGGSF